MLGRTDEDLLIGIAGRDEEALLELSRRYAPYLRAMLRRMTRDREELEEWVEDTMVRVWERADRFDPSKASATTWLVTIAHRLAVNRRRRRPVLREAESDEAGKQALQASSSYLPEALAALDADARHLFELAYFGGYTHEEVAELTGRLPEAVEMGLKRALVQLHDYFAATAP